MSGQNPLQPDAVNCEICIFCKPIIDPMNIGKKLYQCRRNPPQPVMMGGPRGEPVIIGIWPSISGKDACGEFQPDMDGPFHDGPADLDAHGGQENGLIIV